MRLSLIAALALIQVSAFSSESAKTILKGKISGATSIYMVDLDCSYPYDDPLIEISVDEQGMFNHTFTINAPSIYRLYFNDGFKEQYEFLKGQAEHAEYLNFGLCVKFFTQSLDMIIYPGDTIQIRIDNLQEYLDSRAKRKVPEVFFDSQKESREFFEKYRIKFALTDIDDFNYKGLTATDLRAKLHKRNQKMQKYIASEEANINSRTYNFCVQEIALNELCWFYNVSHYLFKDKQALRSNGFDGVESDYLASVDITKFDFPIIATRQYQACLDYYICGRSGQDIKNFDLENILKRIEIAKEQFSGDIEVLYTSRLFVTHMKVHSYSSEADKVLQDYFKSSESDPIIEDVKKHFSNWKKAAQNHIVKR